MRIASFVINSTILMCMDFLMCSYGRVRNERGITLLRKEYFSSHCNLFTTVSA